MTDFPHDRYMRATGFVWRPYASDFRDGDGRWCEETSREPRAVCAIILARGGLRSEPGASYFWSNLFSDNTLVWC